jgi:glycerophosphoryl diester phosphodiesterase
MTWSTAHRPLAAGAVWLLASLGSAWAFDLQGHRGARGLAPENTLPAFAKALSIGVTTLELDVAMTRDGVLVVSHDPALNPNFTRLDGAFLESPGPALRALTLAEVKRYDVGRLKPGTQYATSLPDQAAVDGTPIPALAEVFALAKPTRARFNVETKITPTSGDETPDPETFVRAVVDTARQAGVLDRITIQSFDWRTLKLASAIAPEVPRVCLTAELKGLDTVQADNASGSPWTAGLRVSDFGGSTPRLAKGAGCSTWSPHYSNLTEAALRDAKAAGLTVIPWTVNDLAVAERLIEWGVDGLITDYPDRTRKLLSDKGMRAEGD